jgi:hypothetical protein
MNNIMGYLVKHLRDAGAVRWEAIADAAGVAKSLPRKIIYERQKCGPGVITVQPLLDYFAAVDRGERELPPSSGERKSRP